MIRPAPSIEAIADIAAEVNRHVLAGATVRMPEAAIGQMADAIPGAHGEGLRLFESALAAKVACSTLISGDMIFFRKEEPRA